MINSLKKIRKIITVCLFLTANVAAAAGPSAEEQGGDKSEQLVLKRQINRKQAKDMLMQEVKANPNYNHKDASVRAAAECTVDVFVNSAFTRGINTIDEDSLLRRAEIGLKESRDTSMIAIAGCAILSQSPEVRKSNTNLVPISVDDFRLDYSSLVGKKVYVLGQIQFMMNIFILKKNSMDINPIFIDVSKLPRNEQKNILQDCAVPTSTCKGFLYGTAGKVMNQNGIYVEKIEWIDK